MFDSLSLPEFEWEAGVVEPHTLTAVAHFVNWTADVNDPIMMEMQRQTSRKVQSKKMRTILVCTKISAMYWNSMFDCYNILFWTQIFGIMKIWLESLG